jgi:hypothetical protein
VELTSNTPTQSGGPLPLSDTHTQPLTHHLSLSLTHTHTHHLTPSHLQVEADGLVVDINIGHLVCVMCDGVCDGV